MQGKSKLLGSIIALLVIIIAVLYMAGTFSDKQEPGVKTLDVSTYKGPIITIETDTINRVEQVPGTVIAKQNTQISSRVMAKVEQLNVRAGDTVEKGDLLIMLEQDDVEAQLAQSGAQINAIQASLTQAQKQLQRVKDIYAKGLVSVSAYDDAQATYDNLNANLMVTKEQQKQAQIALSYTHIKSPISGVVIERFVEPGDTATPGTPLLALFNPQQLQLEFNVREQQAIKLQIGQSLMVKVPALNIETNAVISEIVPVADSAARTMVIRLQASENSALMPGLYAQLELPFDAQQGVLIKPNAIHEFGQLSMVYVVEDAYIERRFVRLGEMIDDKQHIIAGLNPGDKLAVDFMPSK